MKAGAQYFSILGEIGIEPEKNPEMKISFEDEIEEGPIPQLPAEFQPLATPKKTKSYSEAVKYLISRNVSREDVLRYNIGYCETGEYKDRIILPSYDSNGNLNFFSARDYSGNTKLNYKLCPFSKNIVGNEVLINFDEPITLVEGQFDAMAVRRNAIPLFGKTMSKKLKYRILSSDVPRVNVFLDNDAYSDALKLCQFLMKNDINVYLVKSSEKDPSILGFEKTWKLIDAATPIDFEDLIKLKLI